MAKPAWPLPQGKRPGRRFRPGARRCLVCLLLPFSPNNDEGVIALSTIGKITTMVFVIIALAGIDVLAANRLLYENFDDQSIDTSRFIVYGHNWAVLNPPQYNLNQVGRGGKGYCFSSGTVSEAHLCWRKNVPNPWPTDEFYVSFWMRYPTFRQTDNHENLKLFYPHWDGVDSYVHYAMCNDDSIYYSAKGKGQFLTQGRWLNCPNQTDGKWHRYEFYVKFSAGIHKFWYDGKLTVNDNFGSGKWTRAMYYISTPSIDAEEPGSFSRQIDDLEVWDGMPTATEPQDAVSPYLTDVSPLSGATSVHVDADITFHVKDSGSGVDKSSISLTINGAKVTPVISGTATDYTVTYNPALNFIHGETIKVVVSAKDLAGNAMAPVSYSFTTEAAPNLKPDPPRGVSVQFVNPKG